MQALNKGRVSGAAFDVHVEVGTFLAIAFPGREQLPRFSSSLSLKPSLPLISQSRIKNLDNNRASSSLKLVRTCDLTIFHPTLINLTRDSVLNISRFCRI